MLRALIIAAALIAGLPALTGCAEPVTKSPYSGADVDRAGLDAEASAQHARAADEAEADAAAEAGRLAAAKAAYERAVADVEGATEAELRRLASEYQAAASSAAEAIERIGGKARRAYDLIQTKHAAAAAALDREEERRAMLGRAIEAVTGSPAAQAAAGSIPGGTIVLGLAGLLTGWLGRRAVHKAEDSGYEYARGEKARDETAAALAALKGRIDELSAGKGAP